MGKIKGALSYIRNLAAAAVVMSPTFAFAAGGSPQGPIQSVIDGFVTLLLFLAPSLGGLALMLYGCQYYFAKDSHDKSDLKASMKAVLIITVLIFIASGTIKWIVSLAS